MIALLRDRKRSTSVVPTTKDFWSAWQSDLDAGLAPELPPGMAHPPEAKRLQVPEWVDWHNPPYGHQAKAIAALDSCDFVGLVAMATGGGKTKTALISSCIVQDRSQRSLLVVIVVPTRVLADQWAQEVREFGVAPVLLSGSTSQERAKDLENIAVSLASDQPRTEVAICTLSLFASSTEIKNVAAQMSDSADTLLIADEVHNFGAPGFMNDPPEFFRYRIGLSATPVRQYDAEGTASLFEYFRSSSEPAFTFTLRDAIRAGCLTPYRYHLHPVELSDDEMDRYRELTQQLRQSGFGRDDGEDRGLTDRQERLLRERRALVEQADAKLGRLEDLLGPSAAELTHTLIYCSAKAVKPLI